MGQITNIRKNLENILILLKIKKKHQIVYHRMGAVFTWKFMIFKEHIIIEKI